MLACAETRIAIHDRCGQPLGVFPYTIDILINAPYNGFGAPYIYVCAI